MSVISVDFSSKATLSLDATESNQSVDLTGGEGEGPTKTVDNGVVRHNDSPMTDLTRQEVDAKLAASEAKLDARLANFDTSIKTGFADLRSDLARMQSEVHKGTADLIKWGVGFAVAIVGATVGLLTFINKASDKPPSPPVQAQPPIVIYAQPAPAAELQAKPPRQK